MFEFILIFIALGIAMFVGFDIGRLVGIDETEERWSDAVKKAAANRNCSCARKEDGSA